MIIDHPMLPRPPTHPMYPRPHPLSRSYTATPSTTRSRPPSHTRSKSHLDYPSYPLPDPNLELHSAAAAGNVGLVHYALTHGQPVNSVLHGVLPLHAACSGGSVSVVRMLIERGADVNAPRLPRRYSDGKKSNAPSVGAAGSTPLHFAAANGHAPIAQILLTCGAIPDKQDKNGMTPEALAEINRHTDVIRVLRVWEHLQRQESHARLSSLGTDEAEVDLSSPTASTSGALGSDEPVTDPSLRYGALGSRKGKERAFSFSSNVSDTGSTTAIKMKQSFEALFRGRASRSASIASTHQPEGTSPSSPMLAGLRISTKNDGNLRIDMDNTPASPLAFSSPTSPGPYGPDGSSLNREASGLSGYSGQSTTTLGLGSMFPDPPDRDLSSSNLASSPSRSNTGPSPSRFTAGPPPSRSNSNIFGSSRRPSLPSILEKAAHPGQTIRHVFRRDRHHSTANQGHDSEEAHSPTSPDSVFSSASRSPPSQSAFRRRQADYSVSPESQRGRRYGRRYMSKHALIHLFRRGHSPPSRSPSPPQRSEARRTPILPEELDEGIKKLRAASFDLDMRQGVVSADAEEQSVFSDQDFSLPNSAPVHKTTFFNEELSLPTFSSLSVDPALIPLPSSPSSSTLASDISDNKLSPINVPERRRTISRKGSGVAVPSPLANEWAQSSDSDSPSARVRRSKSERIQSTSQSTITSPTGSSSVRPSTPSSPLQNEAARAKPRSATLPSLAAATSPDAPLPRSSNGGRIMGLGWSEGMDLRKVASGILRRRSTRSRKRSDPKSPTKLIEDVRSGRIKIQRLSEEKDATPEGDQAETDTIKLATAPGAEGKQSQDSGRTERGVDADGEEDNDEYHDAEDASLFDYTEYSRFAEPLDMDLATSSDRPSTPVVVVQSPVDESGSATVEVIHTPTEEHVDPSLLQSQLASDLVSRLEAREVSDNEAGTTDTEKGETKDRAASEETERGGTPVKVDEIPDASQLPIPVEDKQGEGDAKEAEHAPAPQRKVTPPRSRFVEIIAPEDIQPVRQHTYRSWARFGRHRGASLGTTTDGTNSTRIVTPPSLRMTLGSSDSLGQSPPSHKRVASIKTSPPAPPPSILSNAENRARGKSVSSTSTSTSGQGYSYGHSGSTGGTSLTPPSTLSLGAAQGGFPPVPEHDVVHPQPRRKASTSAEARQLIKQTESDILQIAQLPESLDSSRSLTAQLAAYGESHAMEEVFAEREKQRWVASDDSDRDSFFSALSDGVSRIPSDQGSERPRRPSSINSFGRRSYGASLLSVDQPNSASINNIYDKRAAAYKERMTALTSAPSQTFSSASSTHSRRHSRRAQTARAGSPMSGSWLDVGSLGNADTGDATPRESTDTTLPRTSSPLLAGSSQTHVARTARKTSMPVVSSRQVSKPSSMLAPSVIRSTRSLSPTTSRFGAASFSGVTPLSSVNHSRYAGLTAPMQSLGSVGAVAARSPSITSGFSGMAMSASGSGSPYISIFSSRFTGPHDGDDSDDEEEGKQQYMVIENDWMGGHVVEPEEGDKKKRWGHLNKAFGTGAKQKK